MTSPDPLTPLRPAPRRRLRWAVPAVAAAAVTAAAVGVSSPFAAAGPPDLPDRTAAQLLADVAGAESTPLSGTVVQTSRLGLPELPESGRGGADGPLAMLSGSHTLRVWADGPERVRLALLSQLAEYDVVRNGDHLWTYRSSTDSAVHTVLPERPEGSTADALPTGASTPREAADAALAAIDPSTQVRVEENERVAGRAAYQLVLEPRDQRSLVGSVRLALDAEHGVPLRVQVWGTQDPATPAFEVGFTDVSFERPDASVFEFSAPAGADVQERRLPEHADRPDHEPSADPTDARPGQVTGSGWTRVVELPGADPQGLGGEQAGLLDSLTTRVPEGRLLSSALVSVLLTDDGRVLAGAVPADVLRQAAR